MNTCYSHFKNYVVVFTYFSYSENHVFAPYAFSYLKNASIFLSYNFEEFEDFPLAVTKKWHVKINRVFYMAPIWFHLNLYSIIDIHVFLVNIPFDLIYMNSSISTGLFLDIEIWIDSILISSWAPGTCAAVLCRFCYIYTKNCWMTPELFLNIHPSFLWPNIPLPS